MPRSAHNYSPEYKRDVVEYYIQNCSGESFSSTAQKFRIVGGHVTVKRWFDAYDGTLASLAPAFRSGRPRILTDHEVNLIITTPIRRKNRSYQAVKYSDLVPLVEEVTGKIPSLSTIKRYGKQQENKGKSTIKKRKWEGENTIHTPSASFV